MLFFGSLGIFFMSLVPQWRGRILLDEKLVEVRAGYNFTFVPPASAEGHALEKEPIIDLPLLTAEWVAVAALTAMLISFVGWKSPKPLPKT
jgi:hypothetical protein